MEPGGTLETTRITPAFAALLDWLDENPTISAATIGFETMNEPETYDKFRIALGYNNDIAIGYYAQHVINIYNQIVAAGRTGFKFLVGGWDYSRNWDLFGVPSAYLGGKTIVQSPSGYDLWKYRRKRIVLGVAPLPRLDRGLRGPGRAV